MARNDLFEVESNAQSPFIELVMDSKILFHWNEVILLHYRTLPGKNAAATWTMTKILRIRIISLLIPRSPS